MKKKSSSSKKAGSGGKKSSKKTKNIESFVSKYPSLDTQKLLEVPEVNVLIKYDQNRAESFEIKLPITMSLRKIKEKINERNNNALHSIRIFFLENSIKKYMDNYTYLSLKQIGVKGGDNVLMFYEFDPAVHPLLEATNV